MHGEDELNERDSKVASVGADTPEGVETSKEAEPKNVEANKEGETQKTEEVVKSTGMKEPVKPAKARRVLGVLVVVVLMLGAMVGGIALGRTLGGVEQKGETGTDGGNGVLSGDGNVVPIDSPALGGGGGMPIGEVALMPENDKLTLAFLKMHNTRENSAYSPLSIRYALEMLREGADGATKEQIEALIGDREATRYKGVEGHLSIANSLWVNEIYQNELVDGYAGRMKDKYGADFRVDNFETAANINRWAEDNTLGLMKDAFTDDEVFGLNAALVNVLAIDMEWEQQFWKGATFGGYFDFDKLNLDEIEDITDDQYLYTTMRRNSGNDVYYNLSADATVLAQDLKEYNGTQLQFVAIMPKDLEKYVENVNNSDINRLLSGLRIAVRQNDTYEFSFTAYVPKFSIEGGISDLIADLRELGMTDAFDSQVADFSKMLKVEDFAIDAATQKAKFDFSEEGIKAAAVTLIGGAGGAGGPGPIPSSVNIVVSINKPFMYLVRDKKTGEIWFAGTVYDPNHWADEKDNYTWE